MLASETGSSEPESRARETGTKEGANGEAREVAGDKEKGAEKSIEAARVDTLKGDVKTDSPGHEKKDTKKSGDVTHTVANGNTTKPITDDVNAAASSKIPPTTTDRKDDAAKREADPTTTKEKTEEAPDDKPTKPKDGIGSSQQQVAPTIKDEGDVTTPKRTTKELPVTPPKPIREKLGLTVPGPLKNGSVPSAAITTASTLSPLQRALDDAEDETLMERMARLRIGGRGHQPPQEVAPPAHTDLESDFEECQTAPSGPSTPTSKAGRSFNLILRSEVPLSDDDDFFLDCDSNASVSNFDGL